MEAYSLEIMREVLVDKINANYVGESKIFYQYHPLKRCINIFWKDRIRSNKLRFNDWRNIRLWKLILETELSENDS